MRAMMRLSICLVVLLWGALSASESGVVDRVLRYVNADVITLHDVRQRAIELLREHHRDTPDAEPSRELEARMIEQAIQELSEEALLLQEAERLGVTIDHEYISRRIREQSADIAQDQRLEQQALLREHLRRREAINAVLRFYAQRYPDISPHQMLESYQRQSHARPERLRPWRISLRVPGASVDDEQTLTALRRAFVTASRLADPVLEVIDFDAVRQRYVDIPDTSSRIALMREVLEPLVVPAAQSDDPAVQALGTEIGAVLTAVDQEQDESSLRRLLEDLRTTVAGQDSPAQRQTEFVRQARTLHQRDDIDLRDGRAVDLGMIEAGTLTGAFAQAVADLEAGDMSGVFRSGEHLHLMLVSEREHGSVRPFSEVSAEIRPRLERIRQDVIRQRVVTALLRRATIRDLE